MGGSGPDDLSTRMKEYISFSAGRDVKGMVLSTDSFSLAIAERKKSLLFSFAGHCSTTWRCDHPGASKTKRGAVCLWWDPDVQRISGKRSESLKGLVICIHRRPRHGHERSRNIKKCYKHSNQQLCKTQLAHFLTWHAFFGYLQAEYMEIKEYLRWTLSFTIGLRGSGQSRNPGILDGGPYRVNPWWTKVLAWQLTLWITLMNLGPFCLELFFPFSA